MTVPPRTKRRKRSMRAVRLSCDALWSRAVRSLGYCEKCGATDRQLHPHHVYGRNDFRLRFDLRNGCCLCAYCHLSWAEAYPIEFADWFRAFRHRDAVYLQAERRKGPIKRTLADYLTLERELTERTQ